jgi:hypothetical protein
MLALSFDRGSFRDPEGSVFYYESEVYRTLTSPSAEKMKVLLELPFFKKLVKEEQVINTKLLEAINVFPENFPVSKQILWHERIPFITYPFEWTFSILKDGALLTLDLMEILLEHNYILKDGTAWNICLHKGNPCFFDILSINSYREGQAWEGLSQFLQEFLYPLMLQAYHGIDFQPIWRSTQQGVPVKFLYKTLSKASLFKKGVFKYVYLQEKFSASKTISEATLRNEFSAQAFPKKDLIRLLKDLRTCVESLQLTKDQSVWKDYASQNSYEVLDTKEKESFIEDGLKKLKPLVVMDLGCNTGHYSLIASKQAQVISCDLDTTCLDHIYLQKEKNILPVVLNLMTPSPSMGWRLSERKDIFARLKADTFLALALIHHLCIVQNVPLVSFVKFLKSIAPRGIVEWVDKSDPMVQFLLRNRADIFNDYTFENFQDLISQDFNIEKTVSLNKGTRQLLLLSEKKMT